MPKAPKAPKAPGAPAPGAGEHSSQGPLQNKDEQRTALATEARERIEQGKKDRTKRFSAAAATVKAMAKAYEEELGGLFVPFTDSAGKKWPAIVLGLEEKRKPQLGAGRTAVVARVLVLSGRTMQPILADMELEEKEG